MKASSNQLIRVYNEGVLSSAQKKFEKDAAKLAKDRWRIQNAMNNSIGFWHKITVVYTR